MFNFITDSDAIDNDLSKVFAESKRKEIVKPMTSSTEADEAKEDAMQGIEMEEEPKDEELNDSEKAERTIFIGNLPLSVAEKKPVLKELKKLLLEHGKLESIRFRSIAFANPIPKRAAFITKKFHPQRDSMNAYAVFVEKESVQKALVLNGTVFEGKHLRVDSVAAKKTIASSDVKRSIFIGNLRFDISDEALWEFFGKVGDIENVRVVRDKFTNVGKGFAYVQFKERESVSLALELHESEIAGRKMRIRRCAKPTTLVKLEGQRSKVASKVRKTKSGGVSKSKPKSKGKSGGGGGSGAAKKPRTKPRASSSSSSSSSPAASSKSKSHKAGKTKK